MQFASALKLRDYQSKALEIATGAFRDGLKSIALSLPTALGKTIIFCALTRYAVEKRDKRALIIAHRDELITQPMGRMADVWPEHPPIGIVKAEVFEPDKQIVIASIQTLHRRLDNIPAFDLVVTDEAHHIAVGNTYHKALTRLWELNPAMKHLGVSATLFRADKQSFSEIFEDVPYQMTVLEAMGDGWLSPMEYLTVKTGSRLDDVGVHHGDFNLGELAQAVNTPSRNRLAVETYLEHGNGRKAIVFGVDVDHAQALNQAFIDHGVVSACVHGDTPVEERRGILASFKEDGLQVVTNCMVLTEGFDEPSVSCMLLARPTKSKGLYIQMLGRGLRLHPGKQDCLIIDLQDAARRHSLIGLPDLDPRISNIIRAKSETEKREEPIRLDAEIIDKAIHASIERRSLFDPSKVYWAKCEHGWAVSTGKGTLYVRRFNGGWLPSYVKDYRVNPLATHPVDEDLALGICNDILRDEGAEPLYRPNAMWREHPPTDKQIEALRRAGLYSDVTRLTKGRASDLLNGHYAELTFMEWSKSNRRAA